MNKLQSWHGQILTMAEIKLRAIFSATTSICVVALELPRLVAPDVPTISHTTIEMLLLPDYNYITWAPSIPCCLLSRPPLSRLGNLHTHFRQKPKNFRIFLRRVSPSALTWYRAFFNKVSEACSPVYFATSHTALSHMKPAWVSNGDCSWRK